MKAKKAVSILLTAAMLISILIIATVPVSAVSGDWSVFTDKGQYAPDADPEGFRSVPGYEYTDDGLRMIPADWSDSTPWGTVQTTEAIDLKDGVYMQVRVDEFDYEADDKWFNFNLWKLPEDQFVSEDDKEHYGGECLVRMRDDKDDKKITDMVWQTRLGKDMFAVVEDKQITDESKNQFDSEGRRILTYEIRWDVDDEIYYISVNGVMACDKYLQDMTDYIENECDGKMHVGFSMQNNKKGGTIGCTVLKFGTCEADATTPVGDDSRTPQNYSKNVAEIASPDTVEYGEPAVRLNGDKINSDMVSFDLKSASDVINEDGSVSLTVTNSSMNMTMSVKSSVSYSIKDFSLVMIITKDLCTCTWSDENKDGVISEFEKVCKEEENIRYYAMTGDVLSADELHAGSMMTQTYISDSGESYSCHIADWSDYEGRINSIRFDVYNMKYTETGRNSFDVVEIGFFRSYEEAQQYFAVLTGIGLEEDETTDAETETATEIEADTESATENGTATETVTETDNVTETENEETTTKEEVTTKEESTTNKEEQTTKASTGGDKNNNDKEEKKGCGSVAGVGAIAVVAVAAAGLISFKKKEED